MSSIYHIRSNSLALSTDALSSSLDAVSYSGNLMSELLKQEWLLARFVAFGAFTYEAIEGFAYSVGLTDKMKHRDWTSRD